MKSGSARWGSVAVAVLIPVLGALAACTSAPISPSRVSPEPANSGAASPVVSSLVGEAAPSQPTIAYDPLQNSLFADGYRNSQLEDRKTAPNLIPPVAGSPAPDAIRLAASVAPNERLLTHCAEPRSIVIYKQARLMELVCGSEVAARYPMALGFEPTGHKLREGDGRTPEGTYFISTKFHSKFHRSMEVSYPGIKDAERGLADGVITQTQHNAIVSAVKRCKRPPQNTPLGSFIQVHGGGSSGDWTLGCVATDNANIEAVYQFHRPGCDASGDPRTPITILP